MSAITVEKVSQFKEPVKHSTFQNGQNCSVKLFLKPDVTHRKVKFSHAIVYFCYCRLPANQQTEEMANHFIEFS